MRDRRECRLLTKEVSTSVSDATIGERAMMWIMVAIAFFMTLSFGAIVLEQAAMAERSNHEAKIISTEVRSLRDALVGHWRDSFGSNIYIRHDGKYILKQNDGSNQESTYTVVSENSEKRSIVIRVTTSLGGGHERTLSFSEDYQTADVVLTMFGSSVQMKPWKRVDPVPDANKNELDSILIGRWRYQDRKPRPGQYRMMWLFAEDGTATMDILVSRGSKTLKSSAKFHWSVSQNVLTLVVTDPGEIPVNAKGDVVKETISEVTEHKLTYLGGDRFLIRVHEEPYMK